MSRAIDDCYPHSSKNLRHQFEQVQAEQTKSSLYAARFGEIVDFTRGLADRIYDNPVDHRLYFNNFVIRTLNLQDLYTSGHWKQVQHSWLMMNIQSEDGDEDFKNRLDTIIVRLKQDKILGGFAQTAVPFLVQKGKEDLLPVRHINAFESTCRCYGCIIRHHPADAVIIQNTDRKKSTGPDI